MEDMKNNENEDDHAAYHHVARSVAGFDVIPLSVALRARTSVLQRKADGKINMKEYGNQKCDSDHPKERAEVAQMLRVIIDPTWPKKNLQVAEEVTDYEQH